tara:strand:- start:56 stop:1021 length:966 start_codon:yes stop_codon:yes gene_type:complete
MSTESQFENQELSLKQLFLIVKDNSKNIFLATLCFAIFSVIVALSLPKIYTSSIQLAETRTYGSPIEDDAGSTIAGLGLIGQTNFKINQAQSIMTSWSFVEKFIYDNQLQVELFAGNRIDGNKNLVIDKSLYNAKDNVWLIAEPSSWKLYKKFINNHLVVSQNKTNSTVIVSINHISPSTSKKWVDMYVDYFNKYMGKRKLEQVDRNIEYLQGQISKTSLSYMRETFFEIIEGQIKEKMLAESSPEYALTTITPSMLPELKSFPPRTLICIIITFMGAVITVMYYVLNFLGFTVTFDRYSQKVFLSLKDFFIDKPKKIFKN